ncbi:hypothetical protein [Cellulomonas shaoxiangyii]|uniref:Uncharacterized protein n=1 Tax=Cellulomonas shaoxiangyii TaxID=2566013 RepID=A0A4P7SH37_9CELL|nr:hypothetical protein [Cellulomonas shaoxiangyii]QCB93332.1 hypothetical protein E5225_06970 [Cellulomonas shaoxiangyii]TGY79437.1 hypothetical protein E5226_15500 [Cellulomonas shaoxiangyii]
MSGIDLTEALDAATPALWAAVMLRTYDAADADERETARETVRPVITAALPHIDRQVREQIHHLFRATPASQMASVQDGRTQDYYDGVADALYWAAGIARGEAAS